MTEDIITRALNLMREAIALLDQGNAKIAACYLQMAIDEAERLPNPQDGATLQ